MNKAEMKIALEQHARNVNGNRHRFTLRWAALEPRWTGARCLLSLDVCPERQVTGCWTTLHVLTDAHVTREQLLDLVNDALDEHLRAHGSDPSTSADAGQLLADCVADGGGANYADLVLPSKAGSRT